MTIESELQKVREIVDMLGCDDPDLEEIIKNETDLYKIRDWALSKYTEEALFLDGFKEHIDNITKRKKAAEKRLDNFKSILKTTMDAVGEKTYRGHVGTVSISYRKGTPVVVDESLIPEKFIKIEKKIDKTAINKAVEEGNLVPGTALSNGTETITIRIK